MTKEKGITLSQDFIETMQILFECEDNKESIIDLIKGVGDIANTMGDDKVRLEAKRVLRYILTI